VNVRQLPFVSPAELSAGTRAWISTPGRTAGAGRKRLESTAGVAVAGYVSLSGSLPPCDLPVLDPEELKSQMAQDDLVVIFDPTLWFRRLARLESAGVRNVRVLVPESSLDSRKVAFVFPQLQVVYVPVYKSAYSSVVRFFADQLGYADRFEWVKKHFRQQVDFQAEPYRDYYSFTVVRNPWDRAVSCFEDKFNRPADHPNTLNFHRPIASSLCLERVEFSDYLAFVAQTPDAVSNEHWRSQSFSVCSGDGTPVVDFVAKLESIEEDFAKVCYQLGLQGTLGRFNRSPASQRGYRSYYERSEMVDLLNQRYAHDIQAFGYAYDA